MKQTNQALGLLEGKTLAQTEAPDKGRRRRPRAVAKIDADICTGCCICLEFRPVNPKDRPSLLHCIRNEKATGQFNGLNVVNPEVCIGCTSCAQYCPWEAITMIYPDGTIRPVKMKVGSS